MGVALRDKIVVKKMTSLLAKVVGTPTKLVWAQVHQFSPAPVGPGSADEITTKDRGRLCAALSLNLGFDDLTTGSAFSSVDVGHEVITRLNEEYYGAEFSSPFALLKKAVETTVSEFSNHAKIEICAAVAWSNYIYFCVWGESCVRLYRGGKLTKLLSGKNNEASLASGRFQEGDVFFLTTSPFEKLVELPVLEQMLEQGFGPSELADTIVPLAHKASLPALAVAILKPSFSVPEPQTVGEEVAREEVRHKPPQEEVGVKRMPRASFFREVLVKIAMKLPDSKVDVRTFSPSGRKTAVSVGILLLALFAFSIGFGIKQKQEQQHKLTYASQLAEAQSAYEESLAKKDADLPRARELFLQAKKTTDELIARGIKDQEVIELAAKIQNDVPNILGDVSADTQTFLDLSLVRSGIIAAEIVLDRETIAVLDRGGQRIISVSTGKETMVVGSPEKLKEPRSITVYANRYFSLGHEGVIEIEKKGATVNEIRPDADWGEIIKIGAFNGNLYLLDKKGEIWRYPGASGEFGAKQRWLGSGVTPDFSQTIDMAIDGSIWVLNGNGTILNFTHGVPRLIKPSGLERPLAGAKAIYTDENLDKVYLLDKNDSRIVELAKNGVFQKQYLAPQIAEADDFVVSQKAGKMFLMTREKVLELPL